MSGFGNLLTNPVLMPLGGGRAPRKSKGKSDPGNPYFNRQFNPHTGSYEGVEPQTRLNTTLFTDPLSGAIHKQVVSPIIGVVPRGGRSVAVHTPAVGSRTTGTGAKNRGSRLGTVKPSGGLRTSGTRLPAGTPGGTGAGKLATTGTAKAGGKLAGAGTPKAATSAPAAPQKTMEQIVDDMIAGNIAQNQRATTAYQASNKTLRDGLVAQSAALNGAMPTLTPTAAPLNADGTVNADAQAATLRANAVGSAQGNAITDFVGARQQANNTLLAGLGDVAGQRAVEYAQSQRAQRPGLLSQMQAADDKKQMDLAQMALASRTLGDKESADSYDRQLKALQLQQTGAYQQGQLALGASRIDSSNANAGARNAAAATKFGIQMNTQRAKLAQQIHDKNFALKPIPITDAEGNKSTDYQLAYPKAPWRTSYGQLVTAGFAPAEAAFMASNWTDSLKGSSATFRPGHEAGVYKMIANRTGDPRLALQLVRQHYHDPKWTPNGAPKVVQQTLGAIRFA